VSTIKAILEADSDGTLHLPLPADLRNGMVEVTATLKPANDNGRAGAPQFGCLAGKITLADDFDAPLDDFKQYSE